MIDECKVVDNRVFLLGLDKLYRDAMRQHEHGELLTCARRVAKLLGVSPANAPVEGYYAEEEALIEYFLLMRALHRVRKEARSAVATSPEFRRLFAVASSPIFGIPEHEGLLPVGRDTLSQAMLERKPWTVGGLTAAARDIARASDDISLVGLAALTGDSVMLTATRESGVLYAVKTMSVAPRMPKYVWRVDDELARRARRFVDGFNSLFGEELPSPEQAQAERYWHAHKNNYVRGRCVQLGYDDTMSPRPYYHWAIRYGPDAELVVDELWQDEIWTTARYDRAFHRGMMGQHR